MENISSSRLHPLLAAAAMAVILVCILYIASLTGYLQRWTDADTFHLPERASTTVERLPSILPVPPVQPPVLKEAIASPVADREAVASALALDLQPETRPGPHATRGSQSGGPANGSTAGGLGH